jgi:hypothetical protein
MQHEKIRDKIIVTFCLAKLFSNLPHHWVTGSDEEQVCWHHSTTQK